MERTCNLKNGNSFYLKDIPLSVNINNVELHPGQGGCIARAAGTSVIIIRKFKCKDNNFVIVKLPSKKIQFLNRKCIGTIGVLSNMSHKLEILGKAGKTRNLGIRPSVRGVAMNPIDHPHGGGEGKTSGGRPSVSKWGKLTKGFKTLSLKKKEKNKYILDRINKKG